jgi:hypothetical protein
LEISIIRDEGETTFTGAQWYRQFERVVTLAIDLLQTFRTSERDRGAVEAIKEWFLQPHLQV